MARFASIFSNKMESFIMNARNKNTFKAIWKWIRVMQSWLIARDRDKDTGVRFELKLHQWVG